MTTGRGMTTRECLVIHLRMLCDVYGTMILKPQATPGHIIYLFHANSCSRKAQEGRQKNRGGYAYAQPLAAVVSACAMSVTVKSRTGILAAAYREVQVLHAFRYKSGVINVRLLNQPSLVQYLACN